MLPWNEVIGLLLFAASYLVLLIRALTLKHEPIWRAGYDYGWLELQGKRSLIILTVAINTSFISISEASTRPIFGGLALLTALLTIYSVTEKKEKPRVK